MENTAVDLTIPSNSIQEMIEKLTAEMLQRVAELDKYLIAEGHNCIQYKLHEQPNSRERAYYLLGYRNSFKEILEILGN